MWLSILISLIVGSGLYTASQWSDIASKSGAQEDVLCFHGKCIPRCFDKIHCWEYADTWDPIPTDYRLPMMYEFPVYKVDFPKEYGSYATEKRDGQ